MRWVRDLAVQPTGGLTHTEFYTTTVQAGSQADWEMESGGGTPLPPGRVISPSHQQEVLAEVRGRPGHFRLGLQQLPLQSSPRQHEV